MDLYTKNALEVSKLTTRNYSTSFSMGVSLLGKELQMPVYAIYGFVRVADEIVDTFHDADKKKLLEEFRAASLEAIEKRISTNPILHSFQWVVNQFRIDHDLIHAFLDSMAMDLSKKTYNEQEYKQYIYGSAEVVGLMCLKVFYKGSDQEYKRLVPGARKLGEAFQKINFLRDLATDREERKRIYFPELQSEKFTEITKKQIEKDIEEDFNEAAVNIKELHKSARLGVLVSYTYYRKLFRKIQKAEAEEIFVKRFRISNFRKLLIMLQCMIKMKLGIN